MTADSSLFDRLRKRLSALITRLPGGHAQRATICDTPTDDPRRTTAEATGDLATVRGHVVRLGRDIMAGCEDEYPREGVGMCYVCGATLGDAWVRDEAAAVVDGDAPVSCPFCHQIPLPLNEGSSDENGADAQGGGRR